MIEPVYILIRTSGRPRFFARMMETIKKQTYKNIVTIVHSDDPRDGYVTGDIIIRGSAYGPEYGNGPYNLYNNRLLEKIPDGPGWYHFMDDDDEYYDETVITRMVEKSKRDHMNVARVIRMHGRVFPENWGQTDKGFQTECFFLHTDHKNKARWWGNLNGDGNYSKKILRFLPAHFIEDLIICRAIEGKGCGAKLDAGKARTKYSGIDPREKVGVLGLIRHIGVRREDSIRQGEMRLMKYGDAERLEKLGKVKITYPFTGREKVPPRNILIYQT
jgi:hypothetical protein